MSSPFGLKVPHILGKAINPHPKKTASWDPQKREALRIHTKEQHKLSSSLCSGDWIDTTPM
jgi:hypothetical protein